MKKCPPKNAQAAQLNLDERLPRPYDGAHYSLEELCRLTDRLVELHTHYPGANPHWRPVKRRIHGSFRRLYARWGGGYRRPSKVA